MKEDLGLWKEDQSRLKEMALESFISGKMAFISPFTGSKKSVTKILGLERNDRLPTLRGCFLPYGLFDFLPYMSREVVLERLVTVKHLDRSFPTYFVLSEDKDLELFRIDGPGRVSSIIKKKVKK